MLERIVKSLFWIVGGYKLYVAGSKFIAEQLQKAYSSGGIREFDYEFMSNVYSQPVTILFVKKEDLPAPLGPSNPITSPLLIEKETSCTTVRDL